MKILASTSCVFYLILVHCQLSEDNDPKNRVSYQIGALHYFFDNQTPIRFKSTYPKESFPRPINRVLQSSFGIEYSRKINNKSSFQAELRHFYYKYNDYEQSQLVELENMQIGAMNDRQFISLSMGYNRNYPWIAKGNLYSAIGATARIIDAHYAQSNYISILNQTRIEMIQQNGWSYGVYVQAGLAYSPYSWLTVNTALDLNSFLLLPDNQNSHLVKSRFDLSLRFGVGINF